MIKKILHKLILKYYIREYRDIVKISDDEELKLYLFETPDDVVKLIRAIITAQVLRVFEATNDEERMMAKGAAMILKVMKDCHTASQQIFLDINNDEDKCKAWKFFKKKQRTN